jgi:hypothetical protein
MLYRGCKDKFPRMRTFWARLSCRDSCCKKQLLGSKLHPELHYSKVFSCCQRFVRLAVNYISPWPGKFPPSPLKGIAPGSSVLCRAHDELGKPGGDGAVASWASRRVTREGKMCVGVVWMGGGGEQG